MGKDYAEREDQCIQPTCDRRRLGDSMYCKSHRNIHSGQETRQYRLTQARHAQRHGEFSEHNALLSLRDEIALVKILIEERYNLIKNDSDLMVACGPLNTLFLTLERLVKSCNQLEKSLGNLLNKSALLHFASQVVEVIAEEIEDVPGYEDIVDRISEKLIQVAAETKNPEDS